MLETFKNYLLQESDTQDYSDAVYEEPEILDKAMDLLLDLDPDVFDEDQADLFYEILDMIDALSDYDDDVNDDDEDMSEAVKVRRDLKAKRERSKDYRKNRAQLKLKAAKYRKSAQGKKTAAKAKRMAKLGKTSTGKKIKTYTN